MSATARDKLSEGIVHPFPGIGLVFLKESAHDSWSRAIEAHDTHGNMAWGQYTTGGYPDLRPGMRRHLAQGVLDQLRREWESRNPEVLDTEHSWSLDAWWGPGHPRIRGYDRLLRLFDEVASQHGQCTQRL